MEIKSAEQATEVARQVIGSPYFQPIKSSRVGEVWEVEAVIGTMDDIRVKVEIPEKVVGVVGASRAALVEQLGAWIDEDAIAEAIVDTMEEIAEPEEMTLHNAKQVWLKFLETELSGGLKRTVEAT